jgi:hypothetical protein
MEVIKIIYGTYAGFWTGSQYQIIIVYQFQTMLANRVLIGLCSKDSDITNSDT